MNFKATVGIFFYFFYCFSNVTGWKPYPKKRKSKVTKESAKASLGLMERGLWGSVIFDALGNGAEILPCAHIPDQFI